MLKSFGLLLVLIVLPLYVFAAPAIVSEVVEYDFGQVSQGDKVSYTFRFKNAGDELLEISSVSSSCGCTAALLSSKRIAPGEMGEIKATFDSSRFRGEVTKTITLNNNSPQHPRVQFKLKGIVTELLSLSTNRVSWSWSSVDQEGHSQVFIKNQSQQKIVLQEATSTNPLVKAELDRQELAPGEQAVLNVSGSLPSGSERLNAYLLVATDFKPMPQLRISVSGRLTR